MPNSSNSHQSKGQPTDRRTFLQSAAAAAALTAMPGWAQAHPDDFSAIRGEIEKRHDEAVKRLQTWIRQPSIAAENRGMNEGCELMMEMLREAGFSGVKKMPTDGQPGVFATLDAGAPKTLGLYFMYDVKQADPAEWSSPPFEAALLDKPGLGKIIMGRGAVNQKGPEATLLAAFHAIRGAGKKMPINLVFVAEGEEEIGSPHFPQIVRSPEAAHRMNEAEAKKLLGVQHWVRDVSFQESLELLVSRPTVNIEGIVGGYTGPGGKTILPGKAVAKLDLRLVPDMTAAESLSMLKAHLAKKGFGDIDVNMTGGYDPTSTPADSAVIRAATAVYKKNGIDPVILPRLAGSWPGYVFTGDPLRLPAGHFGLADLNGAHASTAPSASCRCGSRAASSRAVVASFTPNSPRACPWSAANTLIFAKRSIPASHFFTAGCCFSSFNPVAWPPSPSRSRAISSNSRNGPSTIRSSPPRPWRIVDGPLREFEEIARE